VASKAIELYLNDHLGGATLGVNLADQIAELAEGTPLAEIMSSLHAEIEQDRETLVGLMDRMDVTRNPVKQATGWLAETASRLKFSGLSSGEREYGIFMALETMALGVLGKKCLWVALRGADHPALGDVDLDALAARASEQHAILERERLAAGKRALGGA
jgi:hypothetical protein